jgi:hypothetical protein
MAMNADGLAGKYKNVQDRESAYEILKGRAAEAIPKNAANTNKAPGRPRDSFATKTVKVIISSVSMAIGGAVADAIFGTGRKNSVMKKAAKSAVRNTTSSIGRRVGAEILRGSLGSMRR